MKLACSLLIMCLVGCSSTHQLLSTTDGGVDAPPFDGSPTEDGGPDASECGSPPPPGAPCLEFVDDRDGVYCCRDEPTPVECRDGSWQCPLGWFEADECNIRAATCPWFECDAMDAYSSRVGHDCAGITETRYAWDGRACRPVGFGCSFTACVGTDCDSLYETLDECVSARSGCGAGQCEAMNARFAPRAEPIECDGGEGASWWTWNGWACEMHLDCAGSPEHCVGADCESAYPSRAACEGDRRGCIDRCDATDARVSCEGVGGTAQYVWSGHDCELVARCPDEVGCEGSECEEVFTSRDECRRSFRHCVGPATIEDQGAPTCNLGEEDLVEGAVRLGACGISDAPTVISGWFELQLALPKQSLNPGWVTDCNVLRCAAESADCAALEACLMARDGECPDGPLDGCLGTEICRRDLRGGEEHWVPWGDCATLGGTCVMEPTSGDREIAACEIPGNPGSGYGQTWCDRDELVVTLGGESVRLACSEYLPGTVCREIRFAGEFPGVACGYPSPECDEFLSGSVSCEGDAALLCVGGRTERYECVDAGYSGCESGLGCVF